MVSELSSDGVFLDEASDDLDPREALEAWDVHLDSPDLELSGLPSSDSFPATDPSCSSFISPSAPSVSDGVKSACGGGVPRGDM